jgi:hypothetical protein
MHTEAIEFKKAGKEMVALLKENESGQAYLNMGSFFPFIKTSIKY